MKATPLARQPDGHLTTPGGRPAPARCLFCDAALVSRLRIPGDWRRPELTVEYRIGWCTDCSFGRLDPGLSAEETEAAYRVPYQPHGAAMTGGEPRGVRRLANRLRDKLVSFNTGALDIDESWARQEFGDEVLDICEIGCGSGRILEAFRSAGHRVVGVEPSREACEVARAKGLEVHQGHAEAPPASLGERRFDVVVMHHVLEHCQDPAAALRMTRALLKPEGSLVLETPNNEAMGLRWAESAWPWLDIPRHLQFFTAKSLRRICEDAGFEVARLEFRGYARQFQPEWIELEDTIARFVRARRGNAPSRAGSQRARWGLLARTFFSTPRKRFDSVRILATRPGSGYIAHGESHARPALAL
jgi:2-polyprenyl-3-methyl-5-hydroxy-6-metoxy-1,4-benzoquinol methylase